MENKKFRLALFMLPLLTQGGGAEKYFIELARNLSIRGYPTDIITINEKFFAKFARLLHIFTRGNFFRKIDISGRESEENIARLLDKARWIKVSLKNLKRTLDEYDIIYSKNEIVDLVPLKVIGYGKIPPVIVGVHTPLVYTKTKSFLSRLHNFLYLGFFYKWLLRGSQCLHVSNKFTKEIAEKNFRINTRLIYFPFSVKEIHETAEKNKCPITFDSNKKNIIFAGRLGEEKGTDILIRLIRKISSDKNIADRICINIFGSGNKKYGAEVAYFSEKYPFVRYFGHVENKYIPSILNQQDFMVAPSRWETLSFSIIEAQSMGIPVIAFDIPGPSDFVIDGITGFLVKNEDEFFNRMIDLINGGKMFRKSDITENINTKFRPEKIYTEITNMFEDICKICVS